MIDRYGNEIEADLLERFSLDLVDFYRPWGDPRRQSWGRLASLVDVLDRRSDSYLSWARSRDVEVFRDAQQHGRVHTGQSRPQSFEVDLNAQVNMANFFLLQQLIHVTSHSRKQFKGKHWPTPQTAAEIVKQETAQRGFDELMSEIVFVEQDEFDRHVEAHKTEQDILRIERE